MGKTVCIRILRLFGAVNFRVTNRKPLKFCEESKKGKEGHYFPKCHGITAY